MYRPKSTDVWFNLPGAQAAYQPIAAPDPFAARQNVAHNGARFGVYTAMPGVAPTWNAATGWKFNGTTQYLVTDISPVDGWSAFIRYSNYSTPGAGKYPTFFSGKESQKFFSVQGNASSLYAYFSNGNYLLVSSNITSNGVIGIAGQQGFLNGTTHGGAISTGTGTYAAIYIGQANPINAADYLTCTIQSFVVCSRVLSRAEVWLASRQMAYCEQNPDWNAWARRRRYYYAPQAAAAATFQAAWARNANSVIQVPL